MSDVTDAPLTSVSDRKPLIAAVEKQLLGEHMTAILQKGLNYSRDLSRLKSCHETQLTVCDAPQACRRCWTRTACVSWRCCTTSSVRSRAAWRRCCSTGETTSRYTADWNHEENMLLTWNKIKYKTASSYLISWRDVMMENYRRWKD